MPALWHITGRLDGEYVSGFELGRDREQAIRRTRAKAAGARGRLRKGRPRKGAKTLVIDSCERAGTKAVTTS